MHLRPIPARWFQLLAALLALAPLVILGAPAGEEDSLRLVVILTRHGVRAPFEVQQEYGKYAAQPWPKWEVPAGHLTPHGYRQMELMGAYYRSRYTREGLLSGRAEEDAARVYLRANNLQRTIETARAIGEAVLPGLKPEVHSRPAGGDDPLFLPARLPVGKPDRSLAAAAVLGRVGGDLHAVELAHRGAFEMLEKILLGDSAAAPAGTIKLLDLPAKIGPGTGENAVSVQGALRIAGSITDSFMLEYAEGRPMAEVGWGRLTPDRITELLELHALWFELLHGTFEGAQIEASNLASHLADTLEQAADGTARAGALGSPGQKLVVISGHDTNQISLAALLGLTWRLPGTQRNPVLLGSAFVFELRERASDHQFFVRLYQASPTLDQSRTLQPLTLEHPPALAPIFIPGCSEATPGFDAPLGKFEAQLHRVIDPQFVHPSAL